MVSKSRKQVSSIGRVIVLTFVHCLFNLKGGEAINSNNKKIVLNGRVVAPGMFWKAVCDPNSKQSIFFWGENRTGELDGGKEVRKGCFNKKQMMKKGVIHCSSINEARKSLYIPAFNEKNCSPSEKGSSFKTCITKFQ